MAGPDDGLDGSAASGHEPELTIDEFFAEHQVGLALVDAEEELGDGRGAVQGLDRCRDNATAVDDRGGVRVKQANEGGEVAGRPVSPWSR